MWLSKLTFWGFWSADSQMYALSIVLIMIIECFFSKNNKFDAFTTFYSHYTFPYFRHLIFMRQVWRWTPWRYYIQYHYDFSKMQFRILLEIIMILTSIKFSLLRYNRKFTKLFPVYFGDPRNPSKLRQVLSLPRATLHSVHHSDSSRQMPPRIFTSVISERAVNYGELISSLSFAAAKGDYRITSRAEGYGVRRKLAL